MNVKEFLESKPKSYSEFIISVLEKTRRLNAEHSFFREIITNFDTQHASPLNGLPISVKDNICVKGIESCAGSRILAGYVPPFDATAIARIREAGGQIIGKTNQDEFGFGTFSTNSGYGMPKNPHDPDRTCGGSSGGAAGITAAADFPHVALAESTGGSISCPASFCGVVGITPTYGLVSRYGLIDYANSLDKIGTMGKTVQDAALLLSIIAGKDEKDSTTLPEQKKDYTQACGQGSDNIKGMKIGVPKEYFENINEDVEKAVRNALDRLQGMGASIIDVKLPHTKYALAAYYIIATAEASTNLAKYCGMRYGLHKELKGDFNEYFSAVRTEGFGKEAKRRILLGTFARMAGYRDQYYLQAMKIRTPVIQDFKKAFAKVDVLAAPTMPMLPPRFDEIDKLTPLQHYQADVLTVPPNLAGIPMISVPCGFSGKMPIGLHIMADHLQEEKMIRAADGFEQEMKGR